MGKQHNITWAAFEKDLYGLGRGELWGNIWWTNGSFMIKEQFLPKRTVSALMKRKPDANDVTEEIRTLLNAFDTGEKVEINYVCKVQSSNLKILDCFKLPNNNHVFYEPLFRFKDKLFYSPHLCSAADDFISPNYMVMPRICKEKPTIIDPYKQQKHEVQKQYNRFIHLMSES